MRRRIGARPLNFRFVVCYAAVAGALSIATAQEAEIVVRQNQPPILNVLPPTAAERTAPGVGKFVIFTREETSREWDHIAGAWECIPSQPQTPLMKRVEFCHSPWCANPLLDTLVADDGDGLHPRFARLQVNKGRGEYTVNIYDINYRSQHTAEFANTTAPGDYWVSVSARTNGQSIGFDAYTRFIVDARDLELD